MAKEPESIRDGIEKVETAKTDRGASAHTGEPFVNDRGEISFGNQCFTVAVDTDRKEIRIKIDRDRCGPAIQRTLDELHQVLGAGAVTVYETVSEQR